MDEAGVDMWGGTLSRRMLIAQGPVATSAASLAACGSSPGGARSTTSSSPQHGLVDAEVDLAINPNDPSFIAGTVGGRALTALLAQQGQVVRPGSYTTTTKLTGSVGKALTSPVGAFDLESGYLIRQGTITGTDQGTSVRGRAQPNLVRGIGNAADVSGTFGATPFALFANLPVDHPGTVTGTIGGHRDHFEVSPTTQHWNFPIVRLTGDYSGPIDLLALIVGAIAYFAA